MCWTWGRVRRNQRGTAHMLYAERVEPTAPEHMMQPEISAQHRKCSLTRCVLVGGVSSGTSLLLGVGSAVPELLRSKGASRAGKIHLCFGAAMVRHESDHGARPSVRVNPLAGIDDRLVAHLGISRLQSLHSDCLMCSVQISDYNRFWREGLYGGGGKENLESDRGR